MVKRKISFQEEHDSRKNAKLYDLNLISKDIENLKIFYDLIDSNLDIIGEFLESHELVELCIYFRNSNNYNHSDLTLVLNVCSSILSHILDTSNVKYNENAKNFVNEVLDKHMNFLLEFVKNITESSVSEIFMNFLICIIGNKSETAVKLIDDGRLFKSFKFNNLFKVKDDIECREMALLFIVKLFDFNNVNISKKLCNCFKLWTIIFFDIESDELTNIQILLQIIEKRILHDRKIPKDIRVKLFKDKICKSLFDILNLEKRESSEELISIISVTKSILTQLFTSVKTGLGYICYLSEFNEDKRNNNHLIELLTKDHMMISKPGQFKNEIIKSTLKSYPNIIQEFTNRFLPYSKFDSSSLEFVKEVFDYITPEYINSSFSYAVNHRHGAYLQNLACKLSLPSENILTLFKWFPNSKLEVGFFRLIEDISQWLKSCKKYRNMYSSGDEQLKIFIETVLSSKFGQIYTEEIQKIFNKTTDDNRINYGYIEQGQEIISTTTNEAIVNKDTFKTTLEEIKSHLDYKGLLPRLQSLHRYIECVTVDNIKKKHQRIFVEKYANNSEFYRMKQILEVEEEEDNSNALEVINAILGILIKFCDCSKKMKLVLFERLHPIYILNMYNGTLSELDQKLKYLSGYYKDKSQFDDEFNACLFRPIIERNFKLQPDKNPCYINNNICAILNKDIICHLKNDKVFSTFMNYPTQRSYENRAGFQLFEPNESIYDPLFILSLLADMLCIEKLGGGLLLKEESLPNIVMYYELDLFQMLMSCQASSCLSVRMKSRALFILLVEQFSEQLNHGEHTDRLYLFTHFIQTLNNLPSPNNKLPMLYTNFYVRLMALMKVKNADLVILCKMTATFADGFPVNFFPLTNMLIMYNGPECRSIFNWFIRLICHSIGDEVDLLLLHQSNILQHLLIGFTRLDIQLKHQVLELLKRCCKHEKITKYLKNKCSLLDTLLSIFLNNTDNEMMGIYGEILRNLTRTLNSPLVTAQIAQHLQLINLPELIASLWQYKSTANQVAN